MKFVRIKKNLFNSFLYLFLFLNLSSSYSYASGENNNQTNEINKISNSSQKNSQDSTFINEYVLDSGDILRIYFKGLDIYSNAYPIDRDGNLYLPEIDNYYARGKTISEITSDLNKKYEEFIYEPDLKIDIATFRRIKVYISGEVNNPGLHDMNVSRVEATSVYQVENSLGKGNQKISGNTFPKLYDVLLAGEGITNYADLSKIQVIRNNPKNNGGGKKIAEINLLNLIIYGNQENNIYIYDDDIIKIPRSENILKDQFLAINKTNLNPKLINIFITGNVLKSGPISVKKGSSLVQAIASTGGKKIFSGKCEFLRFNNEGDIERRVLRYDPNAKVGSYSNPLLMEGDIINVKRTPIGVLSAAMNEIIPPITSSFFLYDIFGERFQ